MHILQTFIVAQAQENGLPELPVSGPLLERDLRDESWREKNHALLTRRLRQCRARCHERLEFPVQRGKGFLVETRSDFTDIAQLAFVVSAEEKRAKMFPGSGWPRISGYQEFIFLVNFHFQPLVGAPFLIGKSLIFRNQSFIPPALRDAESLEAVGCESVRRQ